MGQLLKVNFFKNQRNWLRFPLTKHVNEKLQRFLFLILYHKMSVCHKIFDASLCFLLLL